MPKSNSSRSALLIALSLAVFLASCATRKEPVGEVCAPCQACPQCAVSPAPQAPAKPMQAARWSDLPGWGDDDVSAAWPAFLHSCRVLTGKPQGALWRPACDEAKSLDGRDVATLRRFFESRFEPWLLTNPDSSTSGMITGYYEPLLRGSRARTGFCPAAAWRSAGFADH